MGKRFFNVSADCKPGLHYMVDITSRLQKIKYMVDNGQYFTINQARQYGKTTILRGLNRCLQNDYYTISMDFQKFGADEFSDEHIFATSFARTFLRILGKNPIPLTEEMKKAANQLDMAAKNEKHYFKLQRLFEELSNICTASNRYMILMIDEIDSAANNQVFLDFLAQLRAYYIDRDVQPTFQSVILAGVYDIKNIRHKLRPEDFHKQNSPWNIAADFNIDMSFSKDEIAGMLNEYETDWHTGMDIDAIAFLLYDYTSGYPFLVSRLCKLIDENVSTENAFHSKCAAWTWAGFNEAFRIILSEKNTLFESLIGKLAAYPNLNDMLQAILFTGKTIAYNPDDPIIGMAMMLGFIKNEHGTIAITNRIFETRLYNLYLSTAELQKQHLYLSALQDKSQFIVDGHLNMHRVLEKFAEHFNDLYHDCNETFIEEIGRKYFLLYLRPIINGIGNYYIEARTRNLGRTDIIVDYRGEQYIIKMKIWRGNEYNLRGEKQLLRYLDDYHKEKGYMISFNFNQNKQIGVHEIVIGNKVLVEAVV